MADIDESDLYDRQIRLWGLEAQKRIQSSRVLICGFGGLGAEVAKNLVLAGISATIVDDGAVTPDDLASNFFLHVGDIGSNRALAALPRIRELNQNVSVQAHASSVSSLEDSFLLQHNIVLLTRRSSLSDQVKVNNLCRSAPTPTAFYAADVFGYEGLLFVDLGEHTYRTESGTGAGSKLSDPITVQYPSLEEACAVPWSALANKRFGPVSPCYAHAQILRHFGESFGFNPKSMDTEALQALGAKLSLEYGVSEDAGLGVALPFGTTEAKVLAATADAELSPVCAVLGGVIGQEVVKFVSGKGAPILNFFALNAQSGEGKVFRSPPK